MMIKKTGRALIAFLMTAALLPATVVSAGDTEKGAADAIQEETQKEIKEETQEEAQQETQEETQEEIKEEDRKAALEEKLLAKVREMLPVLLGMTGKDPQSSKEWIIEQVRKIAKNPDQYSEDFWDSLFGTGADGISKEGDQEEKGTVHFVMELPDPVRMPDTYSVSYHRMDKNRNEVITLLERDADGNIHYLDGEDERVFVRTEDGFHMYPVLEDGFGKWDGVSMSARSVRDKTSPFWDCADQTFIRWLGADLTEETEYLGRPCGLYHAEPGTITFTYKCDMVIDDETGVCLCYTADELLKGAVYNITEDNSIEIDIGDYDIGGDEMNFYCTAFETENVSFEIPEE